MDSLNSLLTQIEDALKGTNFFKTARTFNQDLDLEDQGKINPIQLPAAFHEIRESQTESYLKRARKVKGELTFYVAVKYLDRDPGKILEAVELLEDTLHLLQQGTTLNIEQTGSRQVSGFDKVGVYEVDFSFNFIKNPASTWTQVTPGLGLDAAIQPPGFIATKTKKIEAIGTQLVEEECVATFIEFTETNEIEAIGAQSVSEQCVATFVEYTETTEIQAVGSQAVVEECVATFIEYTETRTIEAIGTQSVAEECVATFVEYTETREIEAIGSQQVSEECVASVESGATYDAATLAMDTKATTNGDTIGDLDALDYWITDSKTKGDWLEADQIILTLTDSDNNVAIYDLKAYIDAQRINSPTFEAKKGYYAPSDGNQIDLVMDPMTQGVKWTETDNARVFWIEECKSPTTTGKPYACTGSNTVSGNNKQTISTGGAAQARVQASGAINQQTLNSGIDQGLYCDYRDGGTIGNINNGGTYTTSVVATDNPNNYVLFKDRTLTDQTQIVIGLFMTGSSALKDYYNDIKNRMITYKSMLP